MCYIVVFTSEIKIKGLKYRTYCAMGDKGSYKHIGLCFAWIIGLKSSMKKEITCLSHVQIYPLIVETYNKHSNLQCNKLNQSKRKDNLKGPRYYSRKWFIMVISQVSKKQIMIKPHLNVFKLFALWSVFWLPLFHPWLRRDMKLRLHFNICVRIGTKRK